MPICQTFATWGTSPAISSKRAKCSAVSRMIAIAPESVRIHWICDGADGLVDRHQHGAREPGGEVDERPLVARLAHEADLVAGLDAGGDEALGEGDDLGVELGGVTSFQPPSAVGSGEQRAVGRLLHPVDPAGR